VYPDRAELLDGDLVVSRAPDPEHQEAGGRLFAWLLLWAEATGLARVWPAPVAVKLAIGERDVEPDLMVHRPDLPLLPGNAAGLPLLGLGLWRWPTVAAAVELLLVLGGAVLYSRAATRLPPAPGRGDEDQRRRAVTATAVVTLLMLLSLVTSVLGVG
jgi:Putative restriction endonuclease